MVVPLTFPSTRTDAPAVTALAELALVPSWYVVEDASVTVTFWPADVVSVKPDEDTPLAVPNAPPAAAPERALDPPPAAPGMPCPAFAAGVAVVADGVAAVADGDVAAHPESPITALNAAAAIHPLLPFGSTRRMPERRALVGS
jgi:hypothetical protein